MKGRALFVSWGQVVRGREAMALDIFKKVHNLLKQAQQQGKINFRIYFNSQSAELTGFMVIHGKPESLLDYGQYGQEVEQLYMQAASVVDNLSSRILVGGTEEGILEHLNLWSDVQKKMGLM